jgi:hypothetical protein
MDTPLFPDFQPLFGGFRQGLERIRKASLSQLELILGPFLPTHLLSQADDGPNSRERIFTVRRTFWGFLFQVLTPGTSCREVALQLRALLGLQGDKLIGTSSGAYCQARARLPLEPLEQALHHSARTADERAGRHGHLAGRPVKVVDATSVKLPDTEPNQRRYPQPRSQKPGCGFPIMKMAALFSLTSGAILDVVRESLHWHDVRLFRRLWSWLRAGDIVLADRAFADYVSLAQLPARGVDLVARLHQGRKLDFRKCRRRLGPHDAVFLWTKPWARPHYLSKKEFKRLPASIEVRILRSRIQRAGFRTKTVYLVTTLLDAKTYSAAELSGLYLRRWRLELCFRDLKTTMGMEELRCLTPAMVHKESLAFLIAHNLLRTIMAEAASVHGVRLERISFKGTVDSVRQFGIARAQARNHQQRLRLDEDLLRVLADNLVPERPGRREPRAVKRRPKPYPLLTSPRHEYKELKHRNRYKAPKKTGN